MKKGHLLFLIGSLFFMFACAQFAYAQSMEYYEALKERANKIKSVNPEIEYTVLNQDIDFIINNFNKIKLAQSGLTMQAVFAVTADAWEDIRARKIISSSMPLTDKELFNRRYGYLNVISEPKTGATIILDEKEVWDKKTNHIKGLPAGTYTVRIELENHLPEPEKITVMVPPAGGATASFKLKEK